MTSLNTRDPAVLSYFMDETLYDFGAIERKPTSHLPEQVPMAVNFLGKNEKNILFLIENHQDDYFSAAAYNAFAKTITALGLTLDDVAVLNITALKTEINFAALTTFFKPKKIVLAGSSPNKLNLSDVSLNTPVNKNGIKTLYTFSFEEMLTDMDKKKLFWHCVKTL